MVRASNSGVNNPHESVAQGDEQVQRAQWWGDLFADLSYDDCLWAEAICNSRIWAEWGPTGATRDVPFMCLLGMGVWDWKDETVSRNNSEIRSFRHTGAIGARLMLRAMEEEEKVILSISSFCGRRLMRIYSGTVSSGNTVPTFASGRSTRRRLTRTLSRATTV